MKGRKTSMSLLTRPGKTPQNSGPKPYTIQSLFQSLEGLLEMNLFH